MDLFGRKEKILRQEIELLKSQLEVLQRNEWDLNRTIKQLQQDNKKLREELEVKDYIGQGIHNILNYNGEPQSKVG